MPTNTFKKATTDLVTNKVILTIITLSHPDPAWGEDINMVNNTTPITSNSVLYTPYGFSFIPPSTSKTGDPVARIEIEDVDKILNAHFRSVNSEVDIVISTILANDPDQIELGPHNFSIISVNTSGALLTLSLQQQTVLRNNLTGFNMDVSYFPGLFI
jgi:hypothetical protein